MHVLGLLISIFFYISLLIVLGLYFYNVLFKNYKQADKMLLMLFLHGLVVVMVLSWALIIMCQGFGIIFELYINNDYSWLIFIFVPILVLIIVADQIVKKHVVQSNSILFTIARFLLPMFVGLVIAAATFIMFSNCNYFVYLTL